MNRCLALFVLPLLIAVSACSGPPPKHVLYVTNERAGTVTMIDTDKQEAIGTITLGKRPRGVVVSPDKTRVYVALSGSPKSLMPSSQITLDTPVRLSTSRWRR